MALRRTQPDTTLSREREQKQLFLKLPNPSLYYVYNLDAVPV
jgi:hypothetical protein